MMMPLVQAHVQQQGQRIEGFNDDMKKVLLLLLLFCLFLTRNSFLPLHLPKMRPYSRCVCVCLCVRVCVRARACVPTRLIFLCCF